MQEKLKNFFGWMKRQLDKFPTLSDKNLLLAGKVAGGVILLSALFFIYEMFSYENFGIKANWNIFSSWLFGPLFVVGFVTAIVKWGAMGHWGGVPYNVYEDEYGNKKKERNNDVVENMFAQILMPILGHFVFEPIIYASIIYYPLMCIVALLGFILPYALTLLLVGLGVGLIIYGKLLLKLPYRTLILVVSTLLITITLVVSAINMEHKKVKEPDFVEEIEMVEELPQTDAEELE